MLDKETAKDLSKDLKIDLFTVYREHLQLLFLKYFYQQKGSEQVYFKGGTALRFLFGSFRFSEDLDFTSLLPKRKIKIVINKALEEIRQEVEKISFKEGEAIADSFTGRLFQTIPEFKFPLTVRLDFSLRERPLLPDTSFVETIFPIGPYPQVSHLKIEEILAEKIRAVLTRKRGRDLFDLYFILSKKILPDWQLVNKKMALYKRKVNLDQLIKTIEKFPQKEIKQDLTKFLPLTHRGLVSKIKELTLDRLRGLKRCFQDTI